MPKRSLGCAACRRRKVKCDLTRPGCLNCDRYGVQCPGYRQSERGIEFMDVTEQVLKKAGCAPPSSSSHSSSSSSSDTTSKAPSAIGSPPSAMVPFQTSIAVAIPTTIDQSWQNQLQLFSLAMELYMPRRNDPYSPVALVDCRVLADLTPRQPALQMAMETLSLAQLGTTYKDEKLLTRSRRRYGQTIQGLVSTLERSKTPAAFDNEIVAIISILGFCEYFEAIKQDGGWTSHAKGLEDLLERRGPLPLTNDVEVALFRHARHTLLYSALGARRRLFLETPEWLAVSRNAPVITDTSTILDIAVRLPGLLGDTDEGVKMGITSPFAVQTVAGLSNLLDDLDAWLAEYNMTIGAPIYENVDIERFKHFASIIEDRTFTHGLNFVTSVAAYLYEIYWICYCFAQTAMLDFVRAGLQPPAPHTPQSIGLKLGQNVRNLCQLIPFFCKANGGTSDILATFLPLRFAMGFYTVVGKKAELKWCRRVANAIYSNGIHPPFVVETLSIEDDDE